MSGVSTREIKNVQPDPQGTSKSNVSRLWQSAGHQFVDQLRDRDLSRFDWAVLMLDGIRLSKDQLAIVAIGITTDGYKHVLDFDSSVSSEGEGMISRFTASILLLGSLLAVAPNLASAVTANEVVTQDVVRGRKTVTIHNADSAGEAMSKAESQNSGWNAIDATEVGKRTWRVVMTKD